MISSGVNLVMTVIGFAVSTLFIIFICTRLVCTRMQLNASRRSFPIAARSDLSILERSLHGLDPLTVANFRTKKYSDSFSSNTKDAQCTVCLSEYDEEDILRILPYCGHSFHKTCIDKWLLQHSTCPVCRISLSMFPDKKPMQPMFSSAIQSQYGTEPLSPHSYHCLSTSPHRADRERRMEPIQENPFASESNVAEAGDSITISIEGSQTTNDSGSKQVDSPSSM
ncbi:hypothetical protein Acr_24g0008230 [Actinidia rufa]|uniref:RING-type domain-containing protein n=1 Tax=Actinidia rufa TaxID=165716 RepID=A0A7J0GV19_9ERIC|nr:hypothetical protein Acr_24g0008230 [Actinidia rufa]